MSDEQDPRDAVIAQLSVTNEQLRRELFRQSELAKDIEHAIQAAAKKAAEFGRYYPI